jgi:tetratricopeptide (TPR) repeat protein
MTTVPSAQGGIKPERIKTPFQLLASWLVALILLDSAFLATAAVVSVPTWAPSLLVIAAVANVPVFLLCIFILQTRYRPEMLADSEYADYIKARSAEFSGLRAFSDLLRSRGIGLQDLASGRIGDDLAAEAGRLLEKWEAGTKRQPANVTTQLEVVDDLRALAEAYMAGGEWHRAAQVLEESQRAEPSDWETHFARGVAYANARGDRAANLKALLAYDSAIAFAPDHADSRIMARLHIYRGAVLKRLGRLAEAEAGISLGLSQATDGHERADGLYNLACIYAMQGKREEMIQNVAGLTDHPEYLGAIRTHLKDYFSRFRSDAELLRLLGVM